MDVYHKVLKLGRYELLRSKITNNRDEGSTGIEEGSLEEPYFTQLVELNYFVNTTGSTNHPSSLFQEMWLMGWIHRNLVTPKLLKLLNDLKVAYWFYKPNGCCTTHTPEVDRKVTVVFQGSTPSFKLRSEIFDLLWHWIYDPQVNNNPWATKWAKQFHKQAVSSSELMNLREKLHVRIREIASHISSGSFPALFDELTIEEKQLVGKFLVLRTRLEFPHSSCPDTWEYMNRDSSDPSPEWAFGYCGSDYCDQLLPLIVKGEVLQFEIWNFYDPVNRDLYSTLLDYFWDTFSTFPSENFPSDVTTMPTVSVK